jgi:hypothetical protein
MTSTATTAEGMAAGSGGDHPVQVTFDPNTSINRLWGIPIIGWMIRGLALIPHAIVLWAMGILIGLSVLVSWIPVLLMGRQASMLVWLYSTYVRYTTRMFAWALFLSGPYPPIIPNGAEYPVNVTVDHTGSINRLWGIPFLGIWARYILVIPHVILLFFLYFAVAFFGILSFAFILINGRMPTSAYALVGGFLRVTARASLYIFLVPVRYPPISLT